MRVHPLAVSWTILTASCLQSPTTASPEADATMAPSLEQSSAAERIGEAAQAAYEHTFHFVVVVDDDGNDAGGGWQSATATLSFVTWRGILPYYFTCPLEVGMPMRSRVHGRISPAYAARITAEVATDVTDSLEPEQDWQGRGVVFCAELRERMKKQLHEAPYQVPATVKRP